MPAAASETKVARVEVAQDRMPDQRGQDRQADEQEEVRVDDRVPGREFAMFQQVEAVVVDPPDGRHHDESADGGDPVGLVPGDVRQRRGDADHRFAQHDDGQQADPLDQVRRVRRHDMQPPSQQHQGDHVEHDAGIEDQVAPGRRQQDRGKADRRADGEHGAHLRREATPVVVLAPGNEIHHGDDQPRRAVAGHGQRVTVTVLSAGRDSAPRSRSAGT